MTGIIINFIDILTKVLFWAIIIRAVLSWFAPSSATSFLRILFDLTEPILAPIRRVLPPLGGIDFSPLLALILLQLVGYLAISLVASVA